MTTRTQRQEFEAWAKRQGYNVGRSFYSEIVQIMWEAWQAATRRANRRKRNE